jgi:hypothetical protein
VTGLTNGTPYTIRLKAVNAAGDGEASASVTATPIASLTVISAASIGGLTAPVRGATPVSTVTPANGYIGTVTWSGSPTTFAASTSYTATITLTAAAGFTLTGVTANFFTVAGATSVTHSANSGVITAVFPATSANSSTTENVNNGPPPSFLKVKVAPTISLSASVYTCDAGTLIFWRYSLTEEPAKLSYLKISLVRNGLIVSELETLKTTSKFERNTAWSGSTMTCQITAVQENTIGTFSSLGSDKYNELAKGQGDATKAANTKYFSDRKAAYDKRGSELLRIADVRAKEISAAKTTSQTRAAEAKFSAARTQISRTWKTEIETAIQNRAFSKAAATKAFTQGLEKFGLAITQP